MDDKHEIDELSGISTTGHEWDGIKELNNPLPRWWINTFYLCILFAIGYTILYPAWPGITGSTKGLLGWSSRHDLQVSLDEATASHAAIESKIANSDIKGVLADPEMKAFAIAAGAATFKSNCTQCHGSGAQGAVGYPNLNDDIWLWGGTPEQIVTTISHGIRFAADKDTHTSQMPAFGHDGILNDEQISDVTNFVLQISKQDHDAAKAANGAKIFTDNCAACHGEKGDGNNDVGAPPLNKQVWLYKGTAEGITAQINNPRSGVMPAWEARLGPTKVKELAAFIVSLGGAK